MDSIRGLSVWETVGEPWVLDLSLLFQRFRKVTDLRKARGKRYPLATLLSIAVLARLAGQQQPQAIADWASLREHALCRLFGLWRHSMPALKTWQRVFGQGLDVDELERITAEFLRESFWAAAPPTGRLCASIDGKTLRGTISVHNPQGVHLLAVYVPQDGIVLAQMEIGSKANEIAAAPNLLHQVDLQGLVITGDAMFAQRALSLQVVAAGGDYIWEVKGNQPALQEEIATLFDPSAYASTTQQATPDFVTAHSTSKGHGRIEVRTLTASSLLQGYSAFPHLAQVFKLETRVTDLTTGQVTLHVRYGATSLSAQSASAQDLLQLVRQHWGIESGLHYRRDVTLGEDRIHVRTDYAAHVHAILNNAIVALLHHHSPGNMARGVRQTTYQIERLLDRIQLT